jgi:GNAT superfamily N-acetyltransferase
MNFDIELIADCYEELGLLAIAHHAEVNVFDDVPLIINWDRYFKAEKCGNYLLAVVRNKGKIIGWIGFFIYEHMRHIGYKIAKEDWYFVVASHRKKGVGQKLFIFAEEILKSLGVRRVMLSCKVAHDHTILLNALGYDNHEKNFTKVLT